MISLRVLPIKWTQRRCIPRARRCRRITRRDFYSSRPELGSKLRQSAQRPWRNTYRGIARASFAAFYFSELTTTLGPPAWALIAGVGLVNTTVPGRRVAFLANAARCPRLVESHIAA